MSAICALCNGNVTREKHIAHSRVKDHACVAGKGYEVLKHRLFPTARLCRSRQLNLWNPVHLIHRRVGLNLNPLHNSWIRHKHTLLLECCSNLNNYFEPKKQICRNLKYLRTDKKTLKSKKTLYILVDFFMIEKTHPTLMFLTTELADWH